MYQIRVVTEPRRKVFLVNHTGEVYIYDSYRKFLSYLRGDVVRYLGKSFRDVRCYYTSRWAYDYRGVFRCIDEKHTIYTYWIAHWSHKSGSIIDPEQIKKDWNEYLRSLTHHSRHRTWWYYRNNRVYEFRKDPVPFIGVSHHHKGTYYRHMKTTQERRLSLATKEDGVCWRGKRNFHNLVNAWDDWIRFNQKNWKKFRKHQWKD